MSHTRQPTRTGPCSVARLARHSDLPQAGKHQSARLHCLHQLQLERLELRALLSGTTFGEEQVIESLELHLPQAALAADLDGDGDQDVLWGAQGDRNPIAWQENIDGAGTFGPRILIRQEDGTSLRSVYAGDMDSDGDLDVLWASSYGTISRPRNTQIAWCENTDGHGNFGCDRLISQDFWGVGSISAVDLDGDTDLDVIASGVFGIVWFENIDGSGGFGPIREISQNWSGRSAIAADLDGDGDLDVLAADPGGDQIAWYENIDGEGTFAAEQIIDLNVTRPNSAYPADLDRDGDLDVVVATYDSRLGTGVIAWYQNTDGAGSFGSQHVISRDADAAGSVAAADLDGDGDLDLLAGRRRTVWFENDGAAGFGQSNSIATGSIPVHVADLDGDGDQDLLATSDDDDEVAWYENTNGAGSFGPQRLVITTPGDFTDVIAADLDGDNDQDVLWATTGQIAWRENVDGIGNLGPKRVIGQSTMGRTSLSTADLDGDGDQDLLLANALYGQLEVVWYENTDGGGSFGPLRMIHRDVGLGRPSVVVADLDGDGDPDLLLATGRYGQRKVARYENTDSAGSFGPLRVIHRDAGDLSSVLAADLDGDGDLDVLSESDDPNALLAWYENTDGRGNFGSQQVIMEETPVTVGSSSVSAVDLDGDGDLDLLTKLARRLPTRTELVWFENDGAAGFGTADTIAGPTDYFQSVVDLDGDGDQDLLTARGGLVDAMIAWYENEGGQDPRVSFGPRQVIATSNIGLLPSVYAADLDGDGDLDVISRFSSRISWQENLLPHPGDANRDGQFDSSDLVQVFQRGEYEDGIVGNSTWEEGDWNDDGEFDSGDLVLAFQKGLYERKSGGVASKIAAAVDALFAMEEKLAKPATFVA